MPAQFVTPGCSCPCRCSAPVGAGVDHARLADQIDLGALTGLISRELVCEVIETAGQREQRRRKLPAVAVLYFVLALCLFSGSDSRVPPGYRSVWRSLTLQLRPPAGEPGEDDDGRVAPTSAALGRARQRLGVKPVELLFDRVRGPRAAPDTPGAFAVGRRLVAWDATTLDVQPTDANIAHYSRPDRGGDPQIRLLALIECGTHAVLDAAFDGIGRASEHALARRVLTALRPGMLLLADRNFPGYELWGLAAATGADLVWRIKKNLDFPPVRVLPDGSYHSVMRTPAGNKRHTQARCTGRTPRPEDGHPVRIIDYTITVRTADNGTRTELFRLVTTLLDHQQAPADVLAGLYHERWESENGYDEFKTGLRGAGFLLRSKLSELVEQELFAFLTVHQALSGLRADAAAAAGLDPDRISFTVTVRTSREQVGLRTTPSQARRDVISDLLADLLPRRRSRSCERVKKPPKNTYKTKKRDHTRPPGRITHEITVTRPQPPAAPTP